MKTLLLVVISLLLIGCQNKTEEALFYLDNEYYNNPSFPLINGDELKALENNNGNFVTFVFMPLYNASALFYDVVSEFIDTHEIKIYRVPFSNIGDTRMADTIRFFPTAVIYHNGLVKSYLDAESDDHLAYYQTAEGFESWLTKYIYLRKEV